MLDLGDGDGLRGPRREAVREVDVLAGEPLEDPRRPALAQLVPAHVRHARRLDPPDGPAEEAETAPALVVLLEQELQADADAEQRTAGGDTLEQRLVQRALAKSRCGAAGVADAGDDGERRLAHLVRIGATTGSAPARVSAAERLRRLPAP